MSIDEKQQQQPQLLQQLCPNKYILPKNIMALNNGNIQSNISQPTQSTSKFAHSSVNGSNAGMSSVRQPLRVLHVNDNNQGNNSLINNNPSLINSNPSLINYANIINANKQQQPLHNIKNFKNHTEAEVVNVVIERIISNDGDKISQVVINNDDDNHDDKLHDVDFNIPQFNDDKESEFEIGYSKYNNDTSSSVDNTPNKLEKFPTRYIKRKLSDVDENEIQANNSELFVRDPTIKPPYTYASMIGQAILTSEKQMMTLSEICNWITKVYPYYRKEQKGWQNSIRHNLSLYDVFEKETNEKITKKGGYWKIPEQYRDCFVNGNYVHEKMPTSRKRIKKVEKELAEQRENAINNITNNSTEDLETNNWKYYIRLIADLPDIDHSLMTPQKEVVVPFREDLIKEDTGIYVNMRDVEYASYY
ncbi:14504_t:CDS:2 [Entrophospora sp. SA101]|nr:4346_t:CDS:2 [Entrophospora sp. SA101]CAJ0634492.1 14504_t:CDS:2 [Entrophospora sp. SA101]CAJ0847497.1 10747_t:CDS:2 [Entrophospora sp. SA101]CAJ0896983.1 10964_t:CDS:2 [Entrophospora sp. SA101]